MSENPMMCTLVKHVAPKCIARRCKGPYSRNVNSASLGARAVPLLVVATTTWDATSNALTLLWSW